MYDRDSGKPWTFGTALRLVACPQPQVFRPRRHQHGPNIGTVILSARRLRGSGALDKPLQWVPLMILTGPGKDSLGIFPGKWMTAETALKALLWWNGYSDQRVPKTWLYFNRRRERREMNALDRMIKGLGEANMRWKMASPRNGWDKSPRWDELPIFRSEYCFQVFKLKRLARRTNGWTNCIWYV